MSIAVLTQVQDETRRLAIAGSAVSPGDFRLKKLIAPLEQAGAKAPVFARVAQAAQAVVDSSEKTASAALLDLATLVHAILYTQGETGAPGDLVALETTDLATQQMPTSARVLKPLLEALSTTGSGRIELVQDAVERGAFRDLRLVQPALKALDDPYPEIGQLIAEKVLPTYGKAVVPALRSALNIKGRGGNTHRLRLLHALAPEETRETLRHVLDEGSKEMRVVAIECLDPNGDDQSFLLEQARSKAKDVRAAAIHALARARSSSPQLLDALKKAIDGEDVNLFAQVTRHCSLAPVHAHVLMRAREQFDATLHLKDAKKQGLAIERLDSLVRCLEGRDDAQAEDFLLQLLDATKTLAKIKSTPSGEDLNELVARVLSEGTLRMRHRLVAMQAHASDGMLPSIFAAARTTLAPQAFFEQFSPMLAGLTKKGPPRARAQSLADFLVTEEQFHHARRASVKGDGRPLPPIALDARWLDTALDTENLELVCALAREHHKASQEFLSRQLAACKGHEEFDILHTMTRVKHPGAADAVIASLRKQAKSSSTFWGYLYRPLIAALPRSAAPSLDALLATLPEKMVDQLMESILELKGKEE